MYLPVEFGCLVCYLVLMFVVRFGGVFNGGLALMSIVCEFGECYGGLQLI